MKRAFTLIRRVTGHRISLGGCSATATTRPDRLRDSSFNNTHRSILSWTKGTVSARMSTQRQVRRSVFNLFDFRQILKSLECRFPFRRERSSPLAGREFSGFLAKQQNGPEPPVVGKPNDLAGERRGFGAHRSPRSRDKQKSRKGQALSTYQRFEKPENTKNEHRKMPVLFSVLFSFFFFSCRSQRDFAPTLFLLVPVRHNRACIVTDPWPSSLNQ